MSNDSSFDPAANLPGNSPLGSQNSHSPIAPSDPRLSANPFANHVLPADGATAKSSGPHRVRFTGTGAEYFGIWIVNMLLIVVTFSIYSSWAKVRREKYFHQHTLIDGSALDYHGKPISILIGRILALGLIIMAGAKEFSFVLAAAAGLLIAAVLPFAMQRSIRFRLFNTSYRGLRFGFHGSVAQAYKISWLIVVLGVAAFIAPAWLSQIEEQRFWIFGLAYAGLLIAYPFFHAAWRLFCIGNAQYGSVNTKAKFTVQDFISVYLRSGFLLGLIPLIGAAIVAIVSSLLPLVSVLLFVPIALVSYACLLSYAPLVGARLQNLCWNKDTVVADANGNKVAEFTSDLNPRNFVLLQLKNLFFTVITLGLYRPYAAIASARMRLEAISISDLSFVDDIAARAGSQKSAVGDEALDAIGLDFSL